MTKKTMAKSLKIGTALALLFTTGCAEYQKRALENRTPAGSEFNKALAEEYKMLGHTEQLIMFDDMDAWRYYYRGTKSADDCTVMPFDPKQWNIKEDRVPELMAARSRLLHAFDHGGRVIAPEVGAHTQAHFDCWVEQSEEGWQKKDIRNCRAAFYQGLSDLEGMVFGGIQGPSANVVLFTNGDASLNAEAMRVIDDAVMDALAPEFGRRIHVIGRTDGKGDAHMNQKLSEARAKAVAEELMKRGVPASMITMEGRGEMAGPQNEADNRRADILYLEYKM